MICIPFGADQPLVAYRVADELGLGIRFDFTKLTSDAVRGAVHKIFSNKSYYERVDHYSKLSRNYIGHFNGAELIMDLLEGKKC
jgi:glucuronosyltransferase